YITDSYSSEVLEYSPDDSPPAPMLTFSFGDPAGDQRGAIDVTGMVMTFERKHGSYMIVLTAAAAHPFTGKFRVNINLYDPDVLKRDPTSSPSVFQAVCSQCGGPIDPKVNNSDFDLGSATTTTLTLPS